MLKKVLKELAAGNGYSLANLAQRLDVSEGLLIQMMEDLAGRGYLAPLGRAEGGGCASCAGCAAAKSNSCCPPSASKAPQGWMLTPKGIEAAQRYE